ncbi:hypothetical protein Scipio_00051 [Acinetobacter phage Scipio]|nr:hypothetical protein Scipio_00051 [Acinetobacter phage Scipio]
MNTYTFTIETRGTKVFEVEANSPEEACKILANCENEKDYLVESDDDWVLDTWSKKSTEEKLMDFIDE